MKTWTFPKPPKALNDFLRLHWAAKNRDLKSWKLLVLSVAGQGPWSKIAHQGRKKVRLKITVYRWNVQDPDNAYGSVKNLVDALLSLGWMVDDRPKWLDLEVCEEIDRKKQRTEVQWKAL
jgi:hypothetical protein